MNLEPQISAEFIVELEDKLREHMAGHERRLNHSLSVAACAEELAFIYGENTSFARVAGILHDWDKYLEPEEAISRAEDYGIDMGVELEKVLPLLHGPLVAHELKELYPKLDDAIFQAISRHTTAAIDMTALDMILYVADCIEPTRGNIEALQKLREKVGKVSLEQLFFDCLSRSISYVIETQRYLWPQSIEVYNYYVNRTRENG